MDNLEGGPVETNRYDNEPVFSNTDNFEHAANNIYEAIFENETEVEEDVLWLQEQRKLNNVTHWMKRPSVVMVGIIQFCFALSNAAAGATQFTMTNKLACNSASSIEGSGQCNTNEAQKLFADYQLLKNLIAGIIKVVALGKVGHLSDLYGRKNVLLFIMVSFVAGQFILFFTFKHFTYLSTWPLILGESISSLGGGYLALLAVCNCYISDVVEQHERIYSIGLVSAFFYVGVTLGPIAGNVAIEMAQKCHYESPNPLKINNYEYYPTKLQLSILILSLFFIILVLPESRPVKSRRKSRALSVSLNSLNPMKNSLQNFSKNESFAGRTVRNLIHPLMILTYPSEFRGSNDKKTHRRLKVAVMTLVFADALMALVGITIIELFPLYGMYKFNWSATTLGDIISITCFSRVIVLSVISPALANYFLTKVLGFKTFKDLLDLVDLGICVFGLLFEALGMLIICKATSVNEFGFALILTSAGTVVSPALNSSLIKYFPESKVGEVFGGLLLLKHCGIIVGPMTFFYLYKVSLSKWGHPSFVFLLFSCFYFTIIAALLLLKSLILLGKSTTPLTASISLRALLKSSNSGGELDPLIPSCANVSYDSNSLEPNKVRSLVRELSFKELHRKNSTTQKQRMKPNTIT